MGLKIRIIVLLGLFSLSVSAAEGYDVAVIGGGTAGFAAALQAGRAGAKTVLVERGFQVGGDMTTGGVNFPGLFHAWGRQVIDGPAYTILTNAVALSGGVLPDFTQSVGKRHWLHQLSVNIPIFVLLAEEALRDAKVELRYHSSATRLVHTNDRWHVTLATPDGEMQLVTRVVIDATGDGTAAFNAGAQRLRGETTSPGSLACVIKPPIGWETLDLKAIDRAFDEAVKAGELLPTDKRWPIKTYLRQNGSVGNYVNNADSSTTARRIDTNVRGRAALLRLFRFLRRQPGLEKIELVSMAPEVGIRETYRVVCDRMITRADYVSGHLDPDSVCYSFYPIDLHVVEKGVKSVHLQENIVPSVPLSALTVKGLPNFLVAGRCIGSDREANSALRVQATCMATGQAAGEAAAFAAASGREVRSLAIAELKRRLVKSGCIVP